MPFYMNEREELVILFGSGDIAVGEKLHRATGEMIPNIMVFRTSPFAKNAGDAFSDEEKQVLRDEPAATIVIKFNCLASLKVVQEQLARLEAAMLKAQGSAVQPIEEAVPCSS